MFTYTTRKDGRLMKKVTINGKVKYLYSNNKEDLEKQYIEAKHMSYNGLNIDDSKITLKQWAEKWYDVNISQKEYNTRRSIRNLLDNHIYPELGHIKLRNLKVINIKELQKNMLKQGLTSTCNRTITTIKRILNDAVENDIIQKNIASNIKSIKYVKQKKKPLTVYEDKLLLKVAKKHKYGLFFKMLRYTGIRTEEIVPLTINDIDLNKKILIIHNAVYFKNGKPYLKTTKNKKDRVIPIADILYEDLKKHTEKCKKNNQNLLFVKQSDEEMLTSATLRWMLKSFLHALNKELEKEQKEKDSNFKLTEENEMYFTNHILRHSFCTMLYYAGVKIKEAQELMGHSSADMVYNIYTHLDKERENSNVLINNYISKTYQ